MNALTSKVAELISESETHMKKREEMYEELMKVNNENKTVKLELESLKN